MKTTLETITPEKALTYLARNKRNRPLREAWVKYLAQQIQTGNFQTTHQGIAFARDGELIDGQHRLTAIARVGKSVQMNVTTGLDEQVFKVTDSGMKRATYDRIHLVNDRSQNQTMCQVINAYCRFALKHHGAVPVSVVEEEFLRYADAWMWVIGQFQHKTPLYGRVGILAALAIYHAVNKEKATEFTFGYRSGEGLVSGSPILALRRAVEYMGKSAGGSASGIDYWKAVTATRAHNAGRQIKIASEATEDMIGNKNSIRLVQERAESRKKAYATRKSKAVA